MIAKVRDFDIFNKVIANDGIDISMILDKRDDYKEGKINKA